MPHPAPPHPAPPHPAPPDAAPPDAAPPDRIFMVVIARGPGRAVVPDLLARFLPGLNPPAPAAADAFAAAS